MKLTGGDKLLIITSLFYIASYFISPSYTLSATTGFIGIFINILPILIFVFIITIIVNYFLSEDLIKKHIGTHSGLKAWIYIILAGIFIPSPPYIVIPILGDLEKKGMRKALIVSFLYARNLQISFLPIMAFYFGLKFSIINIIYVFIFTILSGIFIEKILHRQDNHIQSLL